MSLGISVPTSWSVIPFGELSLHSAFGPRFSSKDYAEDGNIATLRTTDIWDDGRISYDTMPLANLDGQFAKHFLQTGDLVITRSGTCGIAAVFTGYRMPVLPGAFLIRFRLSPKANPLFYRYFFNSSFGRAHVLSTATGAVQQNLNITNLELLEVPCPPIHTQNRIVTILSAYDDLIENNTRRIVILEEMAQVIYREWFVHFRFPGHEKVKLVDSPLGKIPAEWKATTLGEIAINFDRLRKPLSSMQRADIKGPFPYYGAAKIFDYINDYIFDGKYLLVAEDGSVITPDRKPVLQMAYGKFWVNNHTHILQGKEPVSTECLYLALLNTDVAGYVTGAAQPKITQANLNRMPFAVPPQDLQRDFNALVLPLFDQMNCLNRKIENLRKTRDLLLPKLISGQVDVEGLEIIG